MLAGRTTSNQMILLFDLDGVLVDLCHFHAECFVSAYNQYVQPPITLVYHAEHLEGRSTKSKLDLLGVVSPKLQELINAAKQAATLKALAVRELSLGPTHALRWAQEHGHVVGVVSNCVRPTLNLVLARLGIDDCASVSSSDVLRPKPDPEGYLRLADELLARFGPQEVLIFDDSVVGLAAARATPYTVIPVLNTVDVTVAFLEHCVRFKAPPQPPKVRIVIPMGGLGARFSEAGFVVPKPYIVMPDGRCMWEVVVENLMATEAKCEVHLVVTNPCPIVDDPRVIVHVLDKVTEGAACTVLTLRDIVCDDVPLIIANCDQLLEWDADVFYRATCHPDFDGAISTFWQPDETDLKWSYVCTNLDGRVTRVAEKQFLGPQATTGIYGWKRGRDFVRAADAMIAANARVNGEFYVCPVYNFALLEQAFRVVECSKFWPLGIPADLVRYLDRPRPTLAWREALSARYDAMWSKWANRAPSVPVAAMPDLCSAIWCTGKFSLDLDALSAALRPWEKSMQWVDVRHHTFMQLRKAGSERGTDVDMQLWSKAFTTEMAKLPPYWLRFTGVAPTSTGLVLCGYPPCNFETVRNVLRTAGPVCTEPHAQDIYHITLFRWKSPPQQYAAFLRAIAPFRHAQFGVLQPEGWHVGHASLTLDHTVDVRSVQARPSPWVLHRGLTAGANPALENKPGLFWPLLQQGWGVEVDLWVLPDSTLWLGHGEPERKVERSVLRHELLWIHCKNEAALEYARATKLGNFFSHDRDPVAITSQGWAWSQGHSKFMLGSQVHVDLLVDQRVPPGVGICSDYLLHQID